MSVTRAGLPLRQCVPFAALAIITSLGDTSPTPQYTTGLGCTAPAPVSSPPVEPSPSSSFASSPRSRSTASSKESRIVPSDRSVPAAGERRQPGPAESELGLWHGTCVRLDQHHGVPTARSGRRAFIAALILVIPFTFLLVLALVAAAPVPVGAGQVVRPASRDGQGALPVVLGRVLDPLVGHLQAEVRGVLLRHGVVACRRDVRRK